MIRKMSYQVKMDFLSIRDYYLNVNSEKWNKSL